MILVLLLIPERRTPGGHGLLEALPRIYQVTPDLPNRRRATKHKHVRLVFTGNADFVHKGDSANIGTVRTNGTGATYLTHFTGGDVNAFVGGYSPSGRRIVYRHEDHGMYALETMRPDGTHVQTVLPMSSLRPRGSDWGNR